METPPNRQVCGVQGRDVVVVLVRPRMSVTDALDHAAWLVAMAECAVEDPDAFDARAYFDDALKLVRNT